MTVFHHSAHRPSFLVAFLFAAVGCSNTTSDAGGSSSSNSASTSPVTCPSGTIHPRACTEPLSLPSGVDSGVDTTGDYALDVNNDVNAPCPDGYTANESAGDGICCSVPNDTEVTECAEPFPKCADQGDCSSAESWSFPATQCTDATWAAAHESACDATAVEAAATCAFELDSEPLSQYPECATVAPVVRIPWSEVGLTGP